MKKVCGFVKEHHEYGDASTEDFWQNILDIKIADIVVKGCTYYCMCYTDGGNETDRCKESFKKLFLKQD